MAERTCSKCGGAMSSGLVGDRSIGPGRAVWVEGKPSRLWLGLQRWRNGIPVESFRCGTCGFVESYANAD